MGKFVHLHNHTEYSFLDGAIKIPDMVKKTIEYGMDTVAITDHGGLFGAVEFFDTCNKMGVKPILGFEAYIAPGSRFNKTKGGAGEKAYSHLLLIAKDNTGWKNLMKLSSIGYTQGFYYKPRIDMEVLEEYSEGLIASTACVAGAVPRALSEGNYEKAKGITEKYLSIFGEGNLYLELQDHGIQEEKKAFSGMKELGKEMGLPFIVTNDAHYLNKEDAKVHEVLLCLQSNSKMSDKERFRFSTDEVYFRSPEEMAELFPDIPEAMSNTLDIAGRCDVDVKSDPQLPSAGIPEGETNESYLRTLAEEGMEEKYPEVTSELRERLEHELEIIISMGFPGYFLVVRDFVLEADKMGVMRGCRGSAAGSLVAFCIGITNIEPMKFDLIFERFLNPERVSLPDVDVDLADNGRYKVIDYVIDKYGRDAVSQIINFGRMKAKMAVRDVARVLEIPLTETNKIASMITEKTIEKSVETNSDLKKMIKGNEDYSLLIKYASKLQGIARQPGKHAGGVIIAPGDITNWSPLFMQKRDQAVMTQFDMDYVESVGLIKMDFLGLRTLTVLQEAASLVKRYREIDINMWDLDWEDEKTFRLFQNGETTNVFQFESEGMKENLKALRPTSIEDLIAMAALYRPGPMDNIPSFINRKHGKEKIQYPHPMLKEILDVTYGIIVYQEQVMRIAQQMGGFSLGQADILRKAMGKKKADKMAEMKGKFLEGAEKKGIDEQTAKDVYGLIEKFAEYGFNKAHAAVYAHVAYQAAFLKANYPLEYMTAVLTSELGSKEKFFVAWQEVNSMGIEILPPDINFSESNCTVEGDSIRLGLKCIENVGKASSAIVEARGKEKFKTIFDFTKRIATASLNRKGLESLIEAGALDSLPGTRAELFAAVDSAFEYASGFHKDRSKGQTNLFDDSDDVILPEPSLPRVQSWEYTDLLEREKRVLNFYISGHPLDYYREELKSFTDFNFTDTNLQKAEHEQTVLAGGLIKSVKEIARKRDGKRMAFATIEDLFGEAEIMAFPDTYENYSNMIAADAMLIVKGKITKRNEEEQAKIIIDKLLPLSESREKLAKSFHIKCSVSDLDEKSLEDMYSYLNGNRGNNGSATPIVIHVITPGPAEHNILCRNVKADYSREYMEKMKEYFGKENVWLSRKCV